MDLCACNNYLRGARHRQGSPPPFLLALDLIPARYRRSSRVLTSARWHMACVTRNLISIFKCERAKEHAMKALVYNGPRDLSVKDMQTRRSSVRTMYSRGSRAPTSAARTCTCRRTAPILSRAGSSAMKLGRANIARSGGPGWNRPRFLPFSLTSPSLKGGL